MKNRNPKESRTTLEEKNILEREYGRETANRPRKICGDYIGCTTPEQEYGRKKMKLLREIYGDEEVDRADGIMAQWPGPLALSIRELRAVVRYQRDAARYPEYKRILFAVLDGITENLNKTDDPMPYRRTLRTSALLRLNPIFTRWQPARFWLGARARTTG